MQKKNLFGKLVDGFTGTEKVKMVDVESLHLDEKYQGIFGQKEEKIEKIAESMRTSGYDKAEPIVIDENNCVLEGNTRFLAAQRAGLKKVFVLEKRFSSEEEKLVYCYDRQLNRRNLSDAELYKAFQELEEIKGNDGKKKMTDNEIAEKLNTSRRQISKMREVQKKCDDEVLKNLQEGTITLNAAYNEMKEEEKQKETAVAVETKKTEAPKKEKQAERKVDQYSFDLGVKYALEQIEQGKSPEDILKEKRVG